MESFRYQSLTAGGETRQGVISAASRTAAIRQLEGRGETPTLIEQVEAGAEATTAASATTAAAVPVEGPAFLSSFPQAFRRSRTRPRASRAELANLVRELATALEAGLPVMQALRTARRQAPSRAIEAILDFFLERVEAGAPLHQAAQEYGPPFNDLIVGMLRAADASGKMSEVLHQLADLLDRALELRREVLGATLYPAIVFCLVVVSAIILVTVLVPQLIAPLVDQFDALPLPTRIVLAMADFIKAWWLLCLAALAVLWIGWRAWAAIPANRFLIDRTMLRLPVVGILLRDVGRWPTRR
jgi:general secretion pathway protein F